MTDVIENIRRLTAEAIAKGHTYMILSVSGPKRRRRLRVPPKSIAVAVGLHGRWMGDIDQPDKSWRIVAVKVADATAWLKRRGVKLAAPTEGASP